MRIASAMTERVLAAARGDHRVEPVDARSGLDEAAADRVARELDAVAHAELLEDVGPVRLDRLLADREQLGDLAVRVALGDELDDLLLARRERILGELLAGAGALHVVAHERA